MKPSYLEIGAPDDAKARRFFADLFGWSFTPMENGGWFDTGDIKTGLHGKDERPAIVVYFDVTDIKVAVAKVRQLGGKADDPTPEEPGFGRFSTCTDPQSIRFGLRQE
ncbi:VOC family protein [Roseobacter sp. CCS2]|uniref:VOC family protein n=1 Tax=Roseobacter sp. CCS2 TaxID=391593 RepID=UPI0000F400D1|nr:VOC family protein [Roseobacter sp. CCS2]EBA14066.1 Glyoxalase/bleomycin resistance protein/dioxygenase [Roseobacter sp. CCS2]